MTALEPRDAGAFMKRLGATIEAQFGRPRAVLAVSAHTLVPSRRGGPLLFSAEDHQAAYDFGGFSPELYQLRYDAPGAPTLALGVQRLLQQSRLDAQLSGHQGLDHGIWTPLRYMFPEATVPILPMAWLPSESPAALFALGKALSPLTDRGVMVLATGGITHNLHRVFGHGLARIDAPEVPESKAFRTWWAHRSAERNWPELFAWRQRAPHAADMHPTDEHLLPWFIAAGAGTEGFAPQRIHEGQTFGCLGMDAYAFGPHAVALADMMGDRLTAAPANPKLPSYTGHTDLSDIWDAD